MGCLELYAFSKQLSIPNINVLDQRILYWILLSPLSKHSFEQYDIFSNLKVVVAHILRHNMGIIVTNFLAYSLVCQAFL